MDNQARKNDHLSNALQSLRDDVKALDALAVDSPDMRIDELLQRLHERQILVDRIQAAAATILPAAAKSEIASRLERIAEATSSAMAQLHSRVEDMRRRQGQLVTARSAARGYDPDIRRENRTIHREA